MSSFDKKQFIADFKELLAQAIFDKTKETVPVRTGALRGSGKIEFSDLDITISYGGSSTIGNKNVTYARNQEFGFDSPVIVTVPVYTYTNKKGKKVTVEEHKITFKPRQGRFFCKRAIESILQDGLMDIIESSLRSMRDVVEVTKE